MFTHSKISLAILTVSIVAATSGTALAVLPADVQIKYYIHDDPTDPASAIVFKVLLDLEAQDSDSNSVGWEITNAEFRQPNAAPDPDTVWNDPTVFVISFDALWWVDHADTEAPVAAEFDMPPYITGTADAEGSGADLDYEFEGETYTAPPGGPPWKITGANSYSFQLVGAHDPEEEGDDEPGEIDPDLDPPLGEP